ncbi:uncharacterized protein PV09_07903 [Verruconis gallopava]|uniref:Pentatricopeptide repeat domain-containing protein n=1 Tax=Verruconis gallopava TaxID=253628 RepID=A0A0D2A1J2_9PEZI|nr:uncharacterized protein PV09_07903 [Verruconis gallopava]KIW00548.1 hypothetical protein PV09_07903 [Verruconis gallopava]
MQTSLVRLRARPATSTALRPYASSAYHRRLKSDAAQERGSKVRERYNDAFNNVIRKVRTGSRESSTTESTSFSELNTTTQQQDVDADKVRKSNQFRKVLCENSGKSIDLQRGGFANASIPTKQGTSPKKLPFIDDAEETLRRGLDKDDTIQECDKWGKSPEIWLSLLRREARLKGSVGVEQVWTLIKEAEVELPARSAKAGQFWTILLSAPKLHDDVVAYAFQLYARTGRAFPPLYTMIMTYVLRTGSPTRTLGLHRRFLENYIIPRDALRKLAAPASLAQTNLGLEAFRTIYEDLHRICEPCYDQLIPALLSAGKFRQALRWHNILSKNNDSPSPEVARSEKMQVFLQLRQRVQEKQGARWRRLRAHELERAAQAKTILEQPGGSPRPSRDAETRTVPLVSNTAHHKSFKANNSFFTPPEPVLKSFAKSMENTAAIPRSHASTRGLLSSLVSEVQHAGTEGFSDEFCARLYATRALTISWVTSFLHAFSVKKIGPLALRELALRCESTEDLQYYIADLEDKGIAIGTSRFCRAIKRCANDGLVDILRGLLHSDQHPDSLDDERLQRNILNEAVLHHDGQAVHHTLTLMSMFAENPKEEYMNTLLCVYIRQQRINDVLTYANQMQLEAVKITRNTVQEAMHHLLRPRQRGKRPHMLDSRFSYDDLTIVTNLVLRALEAGTEIPEWALIELFKRHGMKNLDSVERFCHAIVDTYRSIVAKPAYDQGSRAKGFVSLSYLEGRQQPDEHSIRAGLPFGNPANPLKALFTPRSFQSIIEWGFLDGLRRLAVARDSHLRPHTRRSDWLTKYRRWPTGVPPPPPQQTFLRGLAIVQDLVDKGVHMWTTAVEAAIRLRLWMLFGPGRSKRRRNITAMALNPYGIVELLRAADKMWRGPTPLFAPVRELLQPLPPDSASSHQHAARSSSGISSATAALASHHNGDGEGFGAELPCDATRDGPPPSKTPQQDLTERQLRPQIEALVYIFWTARTLGVDGDMQENKKALTDDEWEKFLHRWARAAASKRFGA